MSEIRGMTLKQMARVRFFRLCEAYRAVDLSTAAGRTEFVALSVAIHAAKADVPKRLWSLARR